MATGDDIVEFTIKSNVVSSEAIRRFKRSIHIGELKVQDNFHHFNLFQILHYTLDERLVY
jgi:hypothetical protein